MCIPYLGINKMNKVYIDANETVTYNLQALYAHTYSEYCGAKMSVYIINFIKQEVITKN